MKRFILVPMLLVLMLTLTGCRTRTTAAVTTSAQGSVVRSIGSGAGDGESGQIGEQIQAAPGGADEAEARTTERPDAERREYDENASARIAAGAEHLIDYEGDGAGAAGADENNSAMLSDRLHEKSERTATQTVPADESDRMGVSDEAEAADSMLLYYTVLLQDRLSTLFECHRLNLYWETPTPYQTIFKTSGEHQMILRAGCYDVSAKLLSENLTVNAGWVQRKNPGIVVKIVDKSVLGFGVSGDAEAKKVCEELCSRPEWAGIDAVRQGRVLLLSEQFLTSQTMRTAALVCIAVTAYPELFEDVDAAEAVRTLVQEESGAMGEDVLFYVKE